MCVCVWWVRERLNKCFYTFRLLCLGNILQPAPESLSNKLDKLQGKTGDRGMQDQVIAAASMKVPISILSGIMPYSEPRN